MFLSATEEVTSNFKIDLLTFAGGFGTMLEFKGSAANVMALPSFMVYVFHMQHPPFILNIGHE